MWMRMEHDVRGNREHLLELKKDGYRFEISSKGYMVWHENEFIHGAGTLPREKPKHYKHVAADSKRYLFQAVCTAHDHKYKNKK